MEVDWKLFTFYSLVLIPTILLSIVASVYLKLLLIRTRNALNTYVFDEGDASRSRVSVATSNNYYIYHRLASVADRVNAITDNILTPSFIATVVAFFIVTVSIVAVMFFGRQVSSDGVRRIEFILYTVLFFFVGSTGAYLVTVVYKRVTLHIAMKCVLFVSDSTENGLYYPSQHIEFNIANDFLFFSNAALVMINVGLYTLIAFSASAIGHLYFDKNPSITVYLIFAAAAGSHVTSYIVSVTAGSFAEGLGLSLYQIEAETQHRIDSALRIAANLLMSAGGTPTAISGLILDLHALVFLQTVTNGAHWLWYYVVPMLSAISLVMVIPFTALSLSTKEGLHSLIRKARVAMTAAMLASAGAFCLALWALTRNRDRDFFTLSPQRTHMPVYKICADVAAGTVLMLIILIVSEIYVTNFSRVAGQYCDISCESAKNSIVFFSDVFVGISLIIIVLAFTFLVFYEFDIRGSPFTLCGFTIPSLMITLMYRNINYCVGSSLCLGKTAGMAAEVQNLFEVLLTRSEILSSHSQIAFNYSTPILLFIFVYYIGEIYERISPKKTAVLEEQRRMIANGSDALILGLYGISLGILTNGFIMLCCSRATWRSHAFVTRIVDTNDYVTSPTCPTPSESNHPRSGSENPDSVTSNSSSFIEDNRNFLENGNNSITREDSRANINDNNDISSNLDSGSNRNDRLPRDTAISVIAVFVIILVIGIVLVTYQFIGNNLAFVLSFSVVTVIIKAMCEGARGALGSTVKNYVTQGGVAYGYRYTHQFSTALMTAAATTTKGTGSSIISLTFWRLVGALIFLYIPLFYKFEPIY